MKHELPPLPYALDALEPYIDARTMELHHGRHHAAYVKRLNEVLEGHPALQKLSIEQLLLLIPEVPADIRTSVRNHGGGHLNHSFFWRGMKKGGGGEPRGELLAEIRGAFGSFDAFRTGFEKAALDRFGSGWAWLSLDGGKLAVSSTRNQESPISAGMRPLLALDAWEHAYYLGYQDQRKAYIDAWWHVVDWDGVAEIFAREAARK